MAKAAHLMRIQLVVPTGIKDSISPMPSLGVSYIASVLDQEGHDVNVIDNFLECLSEKNILKRIGQFEPDIVGLSFGTENRFAAIKLASSLKKNFPTIPVVVGGPHPSLAWEDLLLNVPSIDVVAIGEGEDTAVDLINYYREKKDLRDVPGIAYREGNRIVHTTPRPHKMNLDELPFPARRFFGKWVEKSKIRIAGKEHSVAQIMTTRGCPHSCNFCAESLMWQKKVRARSVDDVLQEIKHLVTVDGIESIWFCDSTFNLSEKRVHGLCDLMIAENVTPPWSCLIRVDKMNKELLQKMKQAGCYSVALGVESGSNRILREVVGKNTTVEQARDVLKWCKELKIEPHGFFILSHPTETLNEAKMSIQLMKEFLVPGWAKESIKLGGMRIYPGTEIEVIARERGLLPRDFSWTKKYSNVVKLGMRGDVPLFLDKLSLGELSDLIFEWQEITKDPFIKRIPTIFSNLFTVDLFTVGGIRKYSLYIRAFLKVMLSTLKARILHPLSDVSRESSYRVL